MYEYLMMGHVGDSDDVAIIVKAKDLESANAAFTNYLKDKQQWSIGTPIYIEQADELSKAVENAIYAENFDDIKLKYEHALKIEHNNKLNVALVAAYDVVTTFNPYDIAGLICALVQDASEDTFQVDEFGDDRTIIQDGSVVIDTQDELSTFYFLYHSLQSNIEKTMQYYFNSYELQTDIGDDPKNSKLKFTELKAFPKCVAA